MQDVGLIGAGDPTVLAWAADEGRVVLTHDVATMTRYAYERTAAGLPMPGLVEVAGSAQLKVVLDELLLLALASEDGEWEGQVLYVPLR